MSGRPYRLQERARLQEQTRRRIVAATAELHAEVGPATTTISAIAERAGVQRLTVYRHFPDDAGLFAACAAHAAAQHPPPNPARWLDIEEPEQRTRAALSALYAYYRKRQHALMNVLRDAEQLPALREALAPMQAHGIQVTASIIDAWATDARAKPLLKAAVAHALDFWTWRSLDGLGLRRADAVRLMVRFIASVASPAPASPVSAAGGSRRQRRKSPRSS